MTEKLRVVLVGVGMMGSKYAAMIVSGEVKNMELVGLVARKPSAKEWAASLSCDSGKSIYVYSDTEEMFEHAQDYDAVIIATPHKSHEEIAVKAFKLGKHVLCDKPAAATIGQAQRMIKASKECDRRYALVFHQREYEKYRYIKAAIVDGMIGHIRRIMMVNSRYLRTAHYHKSGSWRSSFTGEGGGALINQGAHILDIWQWLFGMPCRIFANIPFGKYNDFCVDDEATITMNYEDGTTGLFMLTTGEAVWQERLEIVGTKGTLRLEDDTLHIYRHEDVQEYILSKNVNSREELSITEDVIEFEKAKEPYVNVLENFAKAVLSGDDSILIAPGTDGINQLMLTNAAYYSAWKKEAVSLPLDASVYEHALSSACEKEC